jgi:L-arabinose isomerase
MELSGFGDKRVWFLTGSQHLYGEAAIKQVEANSRQVAEELGRHLPIAIEHQGVLTTPDAILEVCRRSSTDKSCVGVVAWMHTFSPGKMWIGGLKALDKPLLHLHTQFNRDLPWSEIDMDFMNLNQAAHGDREFGHICTRLKVRRKVVVGHWSDPTVHSSLGDWARAACAWHDWQGMKVARFGDNMRQVSVTEGDKVAAEEELGFSVDGFGVGDLVKRVDKAKDIEDLVAEYESAYEMETGKREAVRDAARIEIGLRNFLEEGGYRAFTTTFEDLHGLRQLPGIAVQRLMERGFGFGAEGDWKTAALVRAMKVMSEGLEGGTSFMEDYTYHLHPDGHLVLGAHMLEVCPSIAAERPRLEVHPLSIGGKEDPARLVFNVGAGPAVNAALIDLGDRFRLLVNEIDVVDAPDLPNLPVARAVWAPRPDLQTSATCWIYAGGAHHTGFSTAIGAGPLRDFAEMAGIECLTIGGETSVSGFKNELRWNEAAKW